MDENMQRLMALGIALLLSYGWLFVPRALRSFDTITICIRCGTLLAAIMAAGQVLIGAASVDGVAGLVVIFLFGPTLLKYAAYHDGLIPYGTWSAAVVRDRHR